MPELSCTVCSGRGRAAIERADDVAQLSAMSGRSIVAGSLNLVTSRPVFFDTRAAVYRNGMWCYFAGRIAGRPVFINRWIGCPAHVFEVFSDTHYRSELGLLDGTIVKLCIADDTVVPDVPELTKLIWLLFWRGRETWFYSCESYCRLMTGTLRHRISRPNQQHTPWLLPWNGQDQGWEGSPARASSTTLHP
jgi:hypothetical protein